VAKIGPSRWGVDWTNGLCGARMPIVNGELASMAADSEFMRRAIEIARRHPEGPYSAVIVDTRSNSVVAEGYNEAGNPVLHDVVSALIACPATALEGGRVTVYSTAEPCPMCASAIVWSGVSRLVFGTSAATLRSVGNRGVDIDAAEVIARSSRAGEIEVVGGVLEKDCDALYSPAGPAD
jgi:tRNA(adenine34) deaminase